MSNTRNENDDQQKKDAKRRPASWVDSIISKIDEEYTTTEDTHLSSLSDTPEGKNDEDFLEGKDPAESFDEVPTQIFSKDEKATELNLDQVEFVEEVEVKTKKLDKVAEEALKNESVSCDFTPGPAFKEIAKENQEKEGEQGVVDGDREELYEIVSSEEDTNSGLSKSKKKKTSQALPKVEEAVDEFEGMVTAVHRRPSEGIPLNPFINIPDQERFIEALDLAGRQERYRYYSNLLLIQAKSLKDKDKEVLLHYGRGRALDKANESIEAFDAFRLSNDLDPAFLPSMWEVRKHYAKNDQWEHIANLVDTQIAHFEKLHESEPSTYQKRLAELYFDRGWIYSEYLNDIERAKLSLKKATEYDNTTVASYLLLEEISRKHLDEDELYDALLALAEYSTDPQRRIAFYQEVADLDLKRGEYTLALEHLKQAEKLSSNSSAILHRMHVIAAEAGLIAEEIAYLEQIGHSLKDDNKELGVSYIKLAAHLASERLNDKEKALDLFSVAQNLQPDDAFIFNQRVILLNELGKKEELFAIFQTFEKSNSRELIVGDIALSYAIALVQQGEDPKDALDLCLKQDASNRGAKVLRNALLVGEDENALIDKWEDDAREDQSEELAIRRALAQLRWKKQPEKALELLKDITTEPAIWIVDEALIAKGDYHALYTRLLQRAKDSRSDDEFKRQVLEESFGVALGLLEDKAKAYQVLLSLSELDPECKDVLIRRAMLESNLGYWDAWVETEKSLLAQADKEEKLRIYFALARHYEYRVKQRDNAKIVYQSMLDIDPGHFYALRRYEALLRNSKDYSSLISVLLRGFEAATKDSEKIALLRKIIYIEMNQLEDCEAAKEHLGLLLKYVPDDLVALRQLAAVSFRVKDYIAHAEALRNEIKYTKDKKHQTIRSAYLAFFLVDRLKNRQEAVDLLESLDLEGVDRNLKLAVYDEMLRLQLRSATYKKALGTLDKIALEDERFHPYSQEFKAYLLEFRLHDNSAAKDIWNNLKREKGVIANLSLLRLAMREKDRDAMKTIYHELSSQVNNSQMAAIFSCRSAALRDDIDEKLAAYQQAKVANPNCLEATLALYGKSKDEADVPLKLMETLKEYLDPKYQGQLMFSLAVACLHSNDVKGAVELSNEILKNDPENVAALFVLERTFGVSGKFSQQAKVWMRLSTLLVQAESRRICLRKAGDAFVKAGEDKNATIAYRHAYALSECPKIYATLKELYLRFDDHENMANLIGQALVYISKKDERIALYLERSTLRFEKLQEPLGAASDLLEIFKLDAKNAKALVLALDIAEQQNDKGAVLEYAGRLLELSEDVVPRNRAAKRMAKILMEQKQYASAAELCHRVFDEGDGDAELAELGQKAYLASGDYKGAIKQLEELIRFTEEAEEKAKHYVSIAIIYREKISSLEKAKHALLLALDFSIFNIDALTELRVVCKELKVEREFLERVEGAKEAVREKLRINPLSLPGYNTLMRLSEWSEDQYTLLATMGVLCVLGACASQEKELYRRRAKMQKFEPRKTLTRQDWEDIISHQTAQSGYQSVWDLIAEGVPKLYPSTPGLISDPSAIGLGKQKPLSSSSDGPVTAKINRIALAFGLTDFDIYLSKSQENIVAGISGQRLGLVLGQRVTSNMRGINSFRIAHTLCLLRDRAFALRALDKKEIEELFAAATMLGGGKIEPSHALGKIEDLSKRLKKAMSRKARKALPIAIEKMRQEKGELSDWIDGLQITAQRAALLVGGDIEVAMHELVADMAGSSERSSDVNIVALKRHPKEASLLAYSISQQYLELRKELQL